MSYGIGAYKKTSVHTASKEQVLIMLYQAAIKFCKKAIVAIEEKNIPEKGEQIGRLQDIIIELNNGLDFEVGGDIARELSSLYDFLLYSTTQANLNFDIKLLQSCQNILETLLRGWIQAIDSLKKEQQQEHRPEHKRDL